MKIWYSPIPMARSLLIGYLIFSPSNWEQVLWPSDLQWSTTVRASRSAHLEEGSVNNPQKKNMEKVLFLISSPDIYLFSSFLVYAYIYIYTYPFNQPELAEILEIQSVCKGFFVYTHTHAYIYIHLWYVLQTLSIMIMVGIMSIILACVSYVYLVYYVYIYIIIYVWLYDYIYIYIHVIIYIYTQKCNIYICMHY